MSQLLKCHAPNVGANTLVSNKGTTLFNVNVHFTFTQALDTHSIYVIIAYILCKDLCQVTV